MTDLPDRIWAKVAPTDTCWLWIGARTKNGYGKTFLEGKHLYAHRVVYAAMVGEIPDGRQLDHTCHVKHCVNPDHLQVVDNQLNGENRKGAAANSKSGVRGVAQMPNGRWRVQVKVGKTRRHGGCFGTLAEAEVAATALRSSMMTNNLVDLRSA